MCVLYIKTYLKDTLVSIIGHVLRYIRGFGSLTLKPSFPQDPAGIDCFPNCFPAATIHTFALLIHRFPGCFFRGLHLDFNGYLILVDPVI